MLYVHLNICVLIWRDLMISAASYIIAILFSMPVAALMMQEFSVWQSRPSRTTLANILPRFHGLRVSTRPGYAPINLLPHRHPSGLYVAIVGI